MKRIMAIALLALLCADTHAEGDPLISDRVSGNWRACKYSDGHTLNINPENQCPQAAPARKPQSAGGVGYLRGEVNEGGERFCVYNVNGYERRLRVQGYDACPLNQRF